MPPFEGIDLFSDTATLPTPAMLEQMVQAPLGDEQRGEDPTTRLLEETACELLAMPRALFFPSATMANQVAIQLHCRPGDLLLAAEEAHILHYESGGPSANAGAMPRPLRCKRGLFGAEQISEAVGAIQSPSHPVARLLCVENTTNLGGGACWPAPLLEEVLKEAKRLELFTHLDGSRLFNAAAASLRTPAELVKGFDTVTLCLSKGLGCPAGALLLFAEESFATVRRIKQRMGGSMRQSGILAAAGVYALENNRERLILDHKNAAVFAQGLMHLEGIELETPEPESNMVYFRVLSDPESWHSICQKKGLRFSNISPGRYRAVTHMGIEEENIHQAIEIVKEASCETINKTQTHPTTPVG